MKTKQMSKLETALIVSIYGISVSGFCIACFFAIQTLLR